MFTIPLLLLSFSCLVTSASAQFRTTSRTHSLARGAVAGIVIACIVGLVLCLILSMVVCRRRRGRSTLPGPGGFGRSARPVFAPGVGGSAPFNGGLQQPGPYQNQQGPPPPPPYHGKETYPGQQGNGPPQPGGFAPPPGPPPAAYMNDNQGRSRWFNKNIR